MKRTYPYKAWTLTPAFKLVEVELVRKGGFSWQVDYDQTEDRRTHRIDRLHTTREAAIKGGFAMLDEQVAKLEKMALVIEKKRAALRKAEQA